MTSAANPRTAKTCSPGAWTKKSTTGMASWTSAYASSSTSGRVTMMPRKVKGKRFTISSPFFSRGRLDFPTASISRVL